MKYWVGRDRKGTQQDYRLYFFADKPEIDTESGEQRSDWGHCGYMSVEIFEEILGHRVKYGTCFEVEIACKRIRSKR